MFFFSNGDEEQYSNEVLLLEGFGPHMGYPQIIQVMDDQFSVETSDLGDPPRLQNPTEIVRR